MNAPTTFHYSTAVSVYDSLGNAQTLQTYYVKRPSGAWDVYAANDGTQIGAGPVATLNFNASGALTTAMPLAAINVPATATGATSPFPVSGGGAGAAGGGAAGGGGARGRNGDT